MKRQREILEELEMISPLVASISAEPVFTVPDGYFDSIAPTVCACLQEARGLSLSGISTDSPGEVPAGYFDSLAGEILQKINAAEEVLPEALQHLRQTPSFSLPEEYFSGLSEAVMHRIERQQLPDPRTLAPGFSVPEGYFASLPEQVLSKVPVRQPARLIPLFRRTWVARAAAAVVIGAVSFAVLKITGTGGPDGNAVAALDPSIELGKNMNEGAFNQKLNELSPDDIVNYLEIHASDAELAVLAASVDPASLPKPEEYLLSEEALLELLNRSDNAN